MEKIRNFCIIAHIDHGKSTLCDRLLEITNTLSRRDLKEQTLDQMDLEREKGITIKLQPVTMKYKLGEKEYQLNLIDTPGHVDFSYEVSRSLAAVEGAILLVDATQGIQAQTLANLYLALGENLAIIPVVNKIDLPNAQTKQTQEALADLLGVPPADILKISAKTGAGTDQVLRTVIKKIPAPLGDPQKPAQALIFDSFYDSFKGVVSYVRLMQGELKKDQEIFVLGTQKQAQIMDVGVFSPFLSPRPGLSAGQIGYVATGLKKVSDCRVGDTIISQADKGRVKSLKGYQKARPMVFASFYPQDGDQYHNLRDALEKLSLNDASFTYQPESSQALGRGFRGGFLGLLHLEIIHERLKREFNLDLIFTAPGVEYQIKVRGSQKRLTITSPSELPNASSVETIFEPWVSLEIITVTQYLGNIMKFMGAIRSIYKATSYLDPTRAILSYQAPLAEIITNLHDALKTASKGYASLSYDFLEFRPSDLVRLDILVAGEKKQELSRIIPRSRSRKIGIKILKKLKQNISQKNFAVTLQAAIGGKIIARENISALRKDVLAKLYGGDRTRKDKLLKKQKKGKKRLETLGRVDIPPKAYVDIMKS
ncbi:MAG: translation elongation factor 4 [Patescibacteria group bacterium]|nr:translation elongation factor 4 [Patescibacteria group bacterium]